MINENCATLLGVGDIILDVPESGRFFDESRETLRRGDVVMGQVEVPHSNVSQWSSFSSSCAPASDPENLNALPGAGFNVATTAGNHTFDQGEPGVLNTLKKLRSLGLLTAGTGANLEEARRPAIIERKGIRFACFEYNCNGPQQAWATPIKAGGAFVKVTTAYEFGSSEPGALPTAVYTVADPATMHEMKRDFEAAKRSCDVVVVGFHLGRMVYPELLQCQTEITHFAIDCGAEMVMCHHPHTLQGVELYRGKPIYYSLGNFVTVTPAVFKGAPNEKQHSFAPFAWPGVTPNIPRFKPSVGKIPNYPFDEVSRNTAIAKGIFTRDGLVEARLIPCWINDLGHPQPVSRENGGEGVLEHIRRLNEIELLDTAFQWDESGTEVLIRGGRGE